MVVGRRTLANVPPKATQADRTENARQDLGTKGTGRKMDGDIIAQDAMTRLNAERASAALVEALTQGGPDRFIWRSAWQGNQWKGEMSATAQRQREACVRILAEKEAVLARVVSRDPCACCGVRGDLHDQFGCGRAL